MRKSILPMLLLLVLTVPLIGEEPATVAKSNAVPVLMDSRPDYAEIQVDGKFIGTTPLNYRLTPGVHRISLTRLRYSPWVRDLTVTANIPTRVAALLEENVAQKAPCPTETTLTH